MKDYFVSAAAYYKKYRPFYPPELLEQIKTSFALSQQDLVLDLGAGTGQLAIGVAPMVKSILAVEPDADMIQYGKELATEKSVTNIEWFHGTDEDLQNKEDLRIFKLATFGASFHWMDQERLLKFLDTIILSNGGLVVTGSKSIWQPSEAWEMKVKEIVQKYLGQERRAGTGKYLKAAKTDRLFEDIIRESPFAQLKIFSYHVPTRHNIDWIIGRLYSTSFANPVVLADKKDEFENEIRRELVALNPTGIFKKIDEYYLFLAKRP